jgi:predicted aminopeptidase
MSETYNPNQIIAISDFARYIRTWSRTPAEVDWKASYENNVARLTELSKKVSGDAARYMGEVKSRAHAYADPEKLERAKNAL